MVVLGEMPGIATTALAAVRDMGAISCSVLLAANSLLGMLLNFALFLCTMHNSALTTTIVGVLKVNRHASFVCLGICAPVFAADDPLLGQAAVVPGSCCSWTL